MVRLHVQNARRHKFVGDQKQEQFDSPQVINSLAARKQLVGACGPRA